MDDSHVRAAATEQPAPAAQFDTPLFLDTPEVDEQSPRVTTSAAASLAAWFQGGNTIVRIGVLILFVGVAFLLRYAIEHEMLSIEFRLAAVAAAGVALLLTGWRLRLRRRGYGLTLQGAGIGVFYMTLYAAMRVYGLVPPPVTLGLMVAIAGLAAVLALWQDALPLAVVGFLGGFAAPLLAGSDTGSPVLLFGYCLVLNLAIAWMASRKAWKLLNLVGFVCTTLVAAAWGAKFWQVDWLASTEPFLIAHLALYLYITVQYSRQVADPAVPAAAEGNKLLSPAAVDAALVFGVPLVVAGFQSVLVRHIPYALAASAATMSAVYLLLGAWLWRRSGERLRLLTEGMLALGAVFLMLVAPLAVDARWSAAAWAVQGAGMAWIAMRQGRPWALAFGLLLQPLAAMRFWSDPLPNAAQLFLLNANFTGVLMLAASALVCARLLRSPGEAGLAQVPSPRVAGLELSQRRAIHWIGLALAVLHLLAGGHLELGLAPWATPDHRQSFVLWTVLIAVVLEALHRRCGWPELAFPARPLLGLAGLQSLAGAVQAASTDAGWARLVPTGMVEVAVMLLSAGWLMKRLDAQQQADDRRPARQGGESLAVLWFAMFQGALAVHALAQRYTDDLTGWVATALIVVPSLLAWWTLSRLDRGRWPMDRHGGLWVTGLALPWMASLVVWSAAVNLFGDGSMRPLPYLPLLNPLDLGHGLLLLYALRLRRTILVRPEAALTSNLHNAQPLLVAAAAAVAFWWLTSALVRSLHHWIDTPMWADGALESGLVQTGLSILWTSIALGTMFVAVRRVGAAHARTVWLVGGSLLGVVVVKLMLVDLSQTSALQRIVSFVGVGLLMLIVGYVAPLPPRRVVPGPEQAS
jgi:uncharacterized membrane protein